MAHRVIPTLPARPRFHPVSGKITRSYPVGRQNFSRICEGDILRLCITVEQPLSVGPRVSLMTTLNSSDRQTWTRLAFERLDDRTLVCQITPNHPGLHSFRAEFSTDEGKTWQPDNVPDAWILIDPPQVNALRIYTLIPTVSGTIADWKADLPRIAGMGFNALHLLPVTAMDTSQSPYAARELFDIDRSYLTTGVKSDGHAQLEDFIAEAKALKLRLVFDLVLNHVGVHSAMATRAPDWIESDEKQPDGNARARYWSGHEWLYWNDLVLVDYEHPSEGIRAEIWAYMIDYALFWSKYADDTGGFVRFDNLHSSDPAFVLAMTTALHREFPRVGVIAEYFIDEGTLLRTGPEWGLNLNLATPWDCKFVPQLRDYLTLIHRVSKHIRYYMPMTSHDSGAPAQEFGSVEATIPRYVAAALLGTGATGITQGVEFGQKEKIEFIGRKPKIIYAAGCRFDDFFRKVNAILVEYPAFRRGENCRFVDEGHAAVIAAFRKDEGAQHLGFLVLCNFDISGSQRIVIDLAHLLNIDGPFNCIDLLTGETHILPQLKLDILLPPCGAQVLKLTNAAGM